MKVIKNCASHLYFLYMQSDSTFLQHCMMKIVLLGVKGPREVS